jgi:hypothetical protein
MREDFKINIFTRVKTIDCLLLPLLRYWKNRDKLLGFSVMELVEDGLG